jgi:hypothetical protein
MPLCRHLLVGAGPTAYLRVQALAARVGVRGHRRTCHRLSNVDGAVSTGATRVTSVTRSRVGRYWHTITFVVAVFALAFQLYLVLSGDNILDSTAAASRGEQTRRFFSYFTIQSNFLVAVSMVYIIRDRLSTQLFRLTRLDSLVGITVTGMVAARTSRPR